MDHQPGELLAVHSISKFELGDDFVEKLGQGCRSDPACVGWNRFGAVFPVVVVVRVPKIPGIRRPNPTCPPVPSCRFVLQTVV